MKTVTASEANRQFSAVLRRVAQGERITVTSRGDRWRRSSRYAGKANRTPGRVEAAPARSPGYGERDRVAPWTRDELYD